MLCSSANGNLLINTILIETKIPRTYREHLECNLQNEGNYISYYKSYKGRSPSNGKLSDFPFYIDSQKSAHRKFKK